MIRHVFRLVWNRRRANALILTEVLISFLVLCALLTTATWLGLNAIRPPGFDYRNVWQVEMRAVESTDTPDAHTSLGEAVSQALLEAERFPEVESAALLTNVPYSGNSSETTTFLNGREENVLVCPATPRALDVLRLKLLAGRWLEAADLALDWRPVVLTESLARRHFGNADPLGRTIPLFKSDGTPGTPEPGDRIERVVGVVADYRRSGELLPTPLAKFFPVGLGGTGFGLPDALVLRLVPGTPPAFEEKLATALRRVAPALSFKIDPLARQRQQRLMMILVPLMVAATIGAFLILMVGTGLIGVLWQSVTRRSAEIGVRRAMGATGSAVMAQILMELLALTTLAVVVGSLLFAQVPLLRILPIVPARMFLLGILEAWVVIYCFVTFCGLYPGWLATRVPPVQALQHE